MPFRSTDFTHWSYVKARVLMQQAVAERRRRKISQAQVNKRMQYSQPGISGLENGNIPGFSLAVFLRYWDALDCDVELVIKSRKEQP